MNRVESMIVDKLFAQCRKRGWEFVGAHDGDERHPGITQGEATTLLHNLDEGWLTFTKGTRGVVVYLVFGNDGWDVICDYHLAKGFEEEVMNAVDEYARTFEE